MKTIWLVPAMLGLALCSSACSSGTGESSLFSTKRPANTATQKEVPDHSEKLIDMKLDITTDKGVVHARLYDNAAVKDFIAMLPLTVTLEDYNKTEKIAGLPKRLSTSGAPDGYTPHKGDIAFYAPWGNLCIFYRDFRYSPALVQLGKIDGDGISTLTESDSVTITIDIHRE